MGNSLVSHHTPPILLKHGFNLCMALAEITTYTGGGRELTICFNSFLFGGLFCPTPSGHLYYITDWGICQPLFLIFLSVIPCVVDNDGLLTEVANITTVQVIDPVLA